MKWGYYGATGNEDVKDGDMVMIYIAWSITSIYLE